ncbi:hypothetical protein AB5I41_09055 [Sphingomonas sp. MMS24-JH45]
MVATPNGSLDLGKGAGQSVTVTFDPRGRTKTIEAIVVATRTRTGRQDRL